MKRSRFTQSQIIEILQQYESGTSALEICSEHQISESTFYGWKLRYATGGHAPHSPTLKSILAQNRRISRRIAVIEAQQESLKGILLGQRSESSQ